MNDSRKPNEEEIISAMPPAEVEAEPSLPVDASITASISSNRLNAYLHIEPPENDGKPPTLEALAAALTKCKIIYGINTDKLQKLVKNPIYNENIEIAQGIMPENGVNGTYSFKVELKTDPKPKIKPDGTVDFRDLGIVENVRKGQLLCEITPPTAGLEGMTVTGKKLLPIKGKAVPSLAGKNTELNQDGTAIYSKIDGQVEYDGRKINVSKTFAIKGNVDNSTGNVKVVGNVEIKGTVFPDFVVEASGDIEIYGTVASAKLKAEGNIILRGGMIGSEVSCQGDLTSKFIENCGVKAQGCINTDYIVNSDIECGQDLLLTGLKGRIIGGNCVVGHSITARTIGSEAWTKTNLKIGNVADAIKRQQELIRKLAGLEKQISSLKSLISMLQQQEAGEQITSPNKAMLKKSLSNYETCVQTLANHQQELAEIKETIRLAGQGKIICTDYVFPGTNITIGSASWFVVDKITRSAFYCQDDVICQNPIQ